MSRRARPAALLAAIVLTAAPLAGCALVVIPPQTTPSQGAPVTDGTTSSLTTAGIDEILSTGTARFDLSRGELRKRDVGLADGDSAGDIVAPRPITLEVVGTDGILRAETDRIRFLAPRSIDTIPSITYFLVAESPADLFALLRRDAPDVGLDTAVVEQWIADMSDAPTRSDRFAFQPGTALGLEVIYDVTYDGAADRQVVTVTVTPTA